MCRPWGGLSSVPSGLFNHGQDAVLAQDFSNPRSYIRSGRLQDQDKILI